MRLGALEGKEMARTSAMATKLNTNLASGREQNPNLRKLAPSARPPLASTLRRLGADDRELLARRLAEPAECIFNPEFRRKRMPGAEVSVAQHAPAPEASRSSGRALVEHVGSTELLTANDEAALFLRFNYCRYRAMRILHQFRSRRLTADATRELIRWEQRAHETRADIVRANTSLVLAMARRSRNTGVELGELVAEGNLALLRCVDKFDVSRGFKFSTYACRAILASFSRAAAKAARVRTVFPTAFDPAMERSDYLDRKRERIELECVAELKEILFHNAADLSPVERRVLSARFQLDHEPTPDTPGRRQTLDQVGVQLGVSKERVRQIQNQAISKLRAVLEQRLPAAS